MTLRSHLLLLLASGLGSLGSPVIASDAMTSASVSPAAETVIADSSAGTNIFPQEAVQLTDDVLYSVDQQLSEVDVLALFGFENSTDRTAEARRVRRSGVCKVYPGDWNFPAKAVWNVFDLLLGGALIKTTPVAAPCYKSSGVYDAAKCADISARFMTDELQ